MGRYLSLEEQSIKKAKRENQYTARIERRISKRGETGKKK